MSNSRTLDNARPSALALRTLEPGRLGVYTVIGGAIGTVPLPWLPDALTRRVRGALVQDIAARHGVTVPRDAREVLTEPSGTEGPRGILRGATRFAVTKVLARFGPIGVLPPIKAGLETFVLGHLLHRYFEVVREERDRRLGVVEARRVRQAIDQALVATLTVDLPSAEDDGGALPGDDRDRMTATIDGVLSRAAGLPSWLVRRLETAFDEQLPTTDG